MVASCSASEYSPLRTVITYRRSSRSFGFYSGSSRLKCMHKIAHIWHPVCRADSLMSRVYSVCLYFVCLNAGALAILVWVSSEALNIS